MTTDNSDLDEILSIFYERAMMSAGQAFAGDPYKITSKSAKTKLLAWRDKAVVEARTESFMSKLREYSITDQQKVLGGLLYTYFLKDTNATKAIVKLSNFSYGHKHLGDLTINAQLKKAGLKDE